LSGVKEGQTIVHQAASLLLLSLTVIGGVGAALAATLLAIPMLVLIATGEVVQNTFGRRQA
jgi:hypothetical protein